MHKAFVSTHRPRLRIRHIQSDGPGGLTFITVANIGGTDATIVRIKGEHLWRYGREWPWGRPNLDGGGVAPQSND